MKRSELLSRSAYTYIYSIVPKYGFHYFLLIYGMFAVFNEARRTLAFRETLLHRGCRNNTRGVCIQSRRAYAGARNFPAASTAIAAAAATAEVFLVTEIISPCVYVQMNPSFSFSLPAREKKSTTVCLRWLMCCPVHPRALARLRGRIETGETNERIGSAGKCESRSWNSLVPEDGARYRL